MLGLRFLESKDSLALRVKRGEGRQLARRGVELGGPNPRHLPNWRAGIAPNGIVEVAKIQIARLGDLDAS